MTFSSTYLHLSVVVQSLNHIRLFATPWTGSCQVSPFSLFPGVCSNSCPLSGWCCLTISSSAALFSCVQSFPASGPFPMSRLFPSGGQKHWSFSFSISLSNEYSGLISLRIDWFYLLAVQRTLKSLLQHHNLKASVLWHSAFFVVQLSHLYMTTGKIIALTRWAFVSKVMSLLFNTLSSIVTAFLPRSRVIPLNSHSHIVEYLLLSPFYRWKMWEISRLIRDHPACT